MSKKWLIRSSEELDTRNAKHDAGTSVKQILILCYKFAPCILRYSDKLGTYFISRKAKQTLVSSSFQYQILYGESLASVLHSVQQMQNSASLYWKELETNTDLVSISN